MNNRYQLFTLSVGLAFLLFTGTSYGLTPKERQLVEGLNAINADLRAQVADNESKIMQKDTDYLFLKSKNDALSANLENSRAMESQQTADLTTAQGKVKALESDRDAQQSRASKNQASSEETKAGPWDQQETPTNAQML